MSVTSTYKFLVRDIYTNEKREFDHQTASKDPRIIHKEGLKYIKYEEDIEKLYTAVKSKTDTFTADKLVYDKRKGFLD